MLKIGLFGAGHLGKIHIQQWQSLPGTEIIGFYDPNEEQANVVSELYGIRRYTDMHELIKDAMAVDIVSTTITHYDIAKTAVLAGKHLFIEKPLAHTMAEAAELVKLIQEANVICQVGHVERFNPAYLSIKDQLMEPMFIETHRLAQFNARGTDVSVILDLMIHDIDIILHLVRSDVKRISASGVAVISETADIANARIEFDNGCVANLTSSRISLKKMRKMRLFQRDAYIGIDFLEKKSEYVKLTDGPADGLFDFPIDLGEKGQKTISVAMPEPKPVNAIQEELRSFAEAILTGSKVQVSVYDGYKAMEVAHEILKKMNFHNEQYNV